MVEIGAAKGAPDRKLSVGDVAGAATYNYGELISGQGTALKPFADVNDVVEVALAGKVVTTTVEGRERYPVRVRFGRSWREDDESGRSGVLLVTASGRHVDKYSWVPARIAHGIAVPQTGAAEAADLAEWNARRSCSGLAP